MNSHEFDFLIVGSGLYGATFAHEAHKKGLKCLVIEKRPHLGGNIFCENQNGINIHKYGAHIFHTSNQNLWNYVTAIVPFNNFINSPIANYKGELYNLPFNMNTFYQMWKVRTPTEAIEIINEQKQKALKDIQKKGCSTPRNLEEQALLLVGNDIYQKLIKGYTEKQWGRKCVDLPAFIIKRLPVRFVYNNNYFNDIYQGIPIGGYNKLIDGLLKGIETKVNTDFFESRNYWQTIAKKIIYTGAIDKFYDYKFGNLAYRSLRFETETISVANYQGNAVVNFTEKEIPYTRIIEHKHFEMFGDNVYSVKHTTITKEYPVEWSSGMEPYYPINDEKNNIIYNRYAKLAEKESNVLFGGRLAEYKYYDMAPVIEKAITDSTKILKSFYDE